MQHKVHFTARCTDLRLNYFILNSVRTAVSSKKRRDLGFSGSLLLPVANDSSLLALMRVGKLKYSREQ